MNDIVQTASHLASTSGDATAARPEGGAQATRASALATNPAESSESGTDLQAQVAGEVIEPLASEPAGPLSEEPAPTGRDKFGRFLKANTVGPRFGEGNAVRLVHGLRSRDHRARLMAAARDAMEAHAAGIRADLGDVSRVRADLVARYVELTVLADSLAANVFASGPLTGKGRTRAATLTLLAVVDRLTRLAAQIGLERRARRVDLDDYLRDRYGNRAGSPQDARTVADDVNPGAIDERPAATDGVRAIGSEGESC